MSQQVIAPVYVLRTYTGAITTLMRLAAYPRRLTLAGGHLAALLEENGKPVLSQFDFFRIIRRMYRESSGKKLYLRSSTPKRADYVRLRSMLQNAGVIGTDPDYRARAIRVLSISDLPAEDIVCLIDPTCYVSHLSAMQRWGLTNRRPEALALTRPDRKTAAERLLAYRTEVMGEDGADAFPLSIIGHPASVRGRVVRVYESRAAGAHLTIRGSNVRLATIGHTFLDMLQRPGLCGGMPHVLESWKNTREPISTRSSPRSTPLQAGSSRAALATSSKNAWACTIAASSAGRHSGSAAAVASSTRPRASRQPSPKRGCSRSMSDV